MAILNNNLNFRWLEKKSLTDNLWNWVMNNLSLLGNEYLFLNKSFFIFFYL